MSHQYFEDNSQLAHDKKTWQTVVDGRTYEFITDSGVFSRGRLDYGTRVMLEALLKEGKTYHKILDLGCGYGPVGVVLGDHYPEAHLDLVDVNERALALAKENLALNQVDSANFYLSSAYEGLSDHDYDLIITNPPIRAGKKVVHAFIEGAYDYLEAGGDLVVVIQKKQGAPSAKKKMEEVFNNVTEIDRDKGYWVLLSQR
ncbi:class I SAM-dependent methyltransferase [Aerococcus urinae]